MNCSVDSKDGKKIFVKMGSYGIGVSRLVAAIIEAKFSNDKMKWPKEVSPFDVVIIPAINKNDNSNLEKAKKFIIHLKKKTSMYYSMMLMKIFQINLKNMILIGIPYQIIVGSKTTKDKFEFKEVGKEPQVLEINKIINLLKK